MSGRLPINRNFRFKVGPATSGFLVGIGSAMVLTAAAEILDTTLLRTLNWLSQHTAFPSVMGMNYGWELIAFWLVTGSVIVMVGVRLAMRFYAPAQDISSPGASEHADW